MSDLRTFDRAWRKTLSDELDGAAGSETRGRILGDPSPLDDTADPEAIYRWTLGMLERMDALLPKSDRKRVLNACGCWMGKEGLRELRALYEQSGDLDAVPRRMEDRPDVDVRLRDVLHGRRTQHTAGSRQCTCFYQSARLRYRWPRWGRRRGRDNPWNIVLYFLMHTC